MQTPLWSLIEAIASTWIGFIVAVLANHFILPLFGYPVTVSHSLQIGLIFTVISFIRGYWVRRVFNLFHGWQARGKS
jgi:hypothetical protein